MTHEINKSLLQALHSCAAVCNYCASACLGEDDVKMMARCIKLDIDCADICGLTASLIARGSDHGYHLLKECIEVCDACAEECEKHAKRMEHCKACAEACRECVEECRAFAGAHA